MGSRWRIMGMGVRLLLGSWLRGGRRGGDGKSDDFFEFV
jgi:hypothetical protein